MNPCVLPIRPNDFDFGVYIILVLGAKFMADDSDALPNVGVWISVHGFCEHVKVL